MDRRVLLGALAGALLAAPVAAWAQPGKVVRIGFLSPASASDPRMRGLLDAFRRGLVELGYVEGRAFRIESRWAEGRYERLPRLAAELVALRVDVILTVAVPAIRAAREATRTIPIVMASVVDPVATGLVASLARPGGNITGLSNMAPDVTGKLLEILKQIVPNASRVAVLWNPGNPGNEPQLRAAEAAGQALGIRLQSLEARTPDDLDPAFAAMARQRADALVVFADVMLNEQRVRIAGLAAAGRLPAVYGQEGPAGGLITYSANTPDLFRRSATYVDRIVKGAKPGDLPVEQATRFDLVIDLKAARALGLTIPQSLLLRADQVIE
ncbi:MAG TPA: ABC transporter substrate-binding protein [Methylomirabilota bacterium]|jgi:putative ABC transport system substrate-binding protein|nr:ABC transporter substrate-binding protein [Methylomirabilota bacterium]